MEFRKEEAKDCWEGISDLEKYSVERGMKQADQGQLEPHSKARNLYKKWI